MEFSQEEIDAFLEEFREETNLTFKKYQDACIRFDVAPMDFGVFTAACMMIITKAPYLREKAELYLEMEENEGDVITEEDNMPPSLFYDLHQTSFGNIFMAMSFTDDGYEIRITPLTNEELDTANYAKLIDVVELEVPDGNEDSEET